MTIEIKVPVLPESVADATIANWHKQTGDSVERDENLVDIETDKVVLEVVAPEDGVLGEIKKTTGDTVTSEEIIATLQKSSGEKIEVKATPKAKETNNNSGKTNADATPSVRRFANENDVDLAKVTGTGKGGKITKEDVSNSLQGGNNGKAANLHLASNKAEKQDDYIASNRAEKRVPMTRLRAKIAERLVAAQQSAAILTTFNEVNMQPVMDLRAKYKEKFEKAHGVKLGFMSFFVKAAIEALKRYPAVNASIDGNDIVYHGYFDIGVAVSTDRGLVVPIIRNADNLSMAAIEKQIIEYGQKAVAGKLDIADMTGGTFTVSNGGIFGSLLSTPILNPPQSGILGMHKIEQRPVVENNQVVVRPMMYLAFSYDHRIIDGKESVGFLLTIKEMLEDPSRILLEI